MPIGASGAWCALVVLAALAAPRAEAQPGTVGDVAEVSNPLRVRLDAGVSAPIGTTVYTLRTVETPTGVVGVLSGTYTVVQRTPAGALLDVAGDGAFATGGPRVGDRVEVEPGEKPGSVRLESDPAGATVSRGGYPVGTTPMRVEVAPGEHTFVVSASGYAPETLTVQAPAGVLLPETRVVLSPPPPAERLFVSAEIAFQDGRYAEADSLLTRAAQNVDASLSAEQTSKLPSLAFAARLGVGVAARGAARGLTTAAIKDLLSKVRFVHDNRVRPETARIALPELEAMLAGDPALAEVRALLPPAPPAPAP